MLRHRWPTLVGLGLGAVTIAGGLEVTTGLAVATIAMAAAYLPLGAARGKLHSPRVLGLEVAAVLGIVALALFALTLGQRPGGYVLAAAWLGHSAWDFAHHRANRVVPRGWAEFCGVFDAMIAAAILGLT